MKTQYWPYGPFLRARAGHILTKDQLLIEGAVYAENVSNLYSVLMIALSQSYYTMYVKDISTKIPLISTIWDQLQYFQV